MFFWRWELYTHLYMNAIDTPKKYFLNSTIFLCFTGKKSSFAPPKMWFLKFIILRKKIARSVSRFLLNISGNYETPRLIRSRSQFCPTWHNWFWPVLPPWKLHSWHQLQPGRVGPPRQWWILDSDKKSWNIKKMFFYQLFNIIQQQKIV